MADVALVVPYFGAPRWARMAQEAAYTHFKKHGHIAKVFVSGGRTMSEALNNGAKMAQNQGLDYCSFVGADGDWLSKDYFERLLPLARPDTIAAPAVAYVDSAGIPAPPQSLADRNIEYMNPCVCGSLMSSARIVEIGFKDWPIWEDWAMFLTAVRRGDSIAHSGDAIYFAQERADSRNKAIGVDPVIVYNDIKKLSY